jgi:endoglycosylceramidase
VLWGTDERILFILAVAAFSRYRKVMRRALALLAVFLITAPCARAAVDGRRFRFFDGRLRDQRGREVALRGVNARAQGIFDVTFADGRLPLEDIPTFDAGDAERMRAFGFNLLRLPISWSALEAVPGRYDRRYLDRIAAVVNICQRHGILVIVDFHQDAFSKEIGQDGAPRWTLDLLLGPTGYPYLGGPLTDLGIRRFAPATLAAFRQFFADADRIQDRFAAAATAVAKRFRRARGVLGYEIMNEPFALAAGGTQAQLDTFHVRVATAIRGVDRRHLIVFEPDTIRNVLNRAPVPAAPFPVPGAMYAPHIYTGVFDGLDFSSGDPALLAPSMERAAAEAVAWGTPLLVGEYGIDPASPVANRWITAELDLQDRLRAHSTFWLWEEISSGHWGLYDGESADGGERVARTHALSRVYARAVPGTVVEHAFDDAANTLRLRYEARGSAPLELFVPPRRYPGGFVMRCDGRPLATPRSAKDGIVQVRCGRDGGERVVEVEPAR